MALYFPSPVGANIACNCVALLKYLVSMMIFLTPCCETRDYCATVIVSCGSSPNSITLLHREPHLLETIKILYHICLLFLFSQNILCLPYLFFFPFWYPLENVWPVLSRAFSQTIFRSKGSSPVTFQEWTWKSELQLQRQTKLSETTWWNCWEW